MTTAGDASDAAAPLEHVVRETAGAVRLVDYMKDRLAVVPVRAIGDLITAGFVRICEHAGTVRGRPGDLVRDGDRITIERHALARLEEAARWNPPWDHALQIHHDDDHMIVVDKPAGLHVHPLGAERSCTLVNALIYRAGARDDAPWARWRPRVVGRLDRAASGLLLVAKSAAIKASLVGAQKLGGIDRIYRAMVHGWMQGEGGEIDLPLGREPGRGFRRAVRSTEAGGRAAWTRWTVVERFDDRTLIELSPRTGRTHQIRVHLAAIGHAIVGDDLYATSSPAERPIRPLALRATQLILRHPSSGEQLRFASPVPADFGLD